MSAVRSRVTASLRPTPASRTTASPAAAISWSIPTSRPGSSAASRDIGAREVELDLGGEEADGRGHAGGGGQDRPRDAEGLGEPAAVERPRAPEGGEGE